MPSSLFEQCEFVVQPPPLGIGDLAEQARLLKAPLVKYLPEPYATRFLAEGGARCRTLASCRSMEDCGQARHDPLEGQRTDNVQRAVLGPSDSALPILVRDNPDVDILLKDSVVSSNAPPGLVFCMSRRISTSLARKWRAEGGDGAPAICIRINDHVEFLRRLHAAVTKAAGVPGGAFQPCVYRPASLVFSGKYTEDHPAFVKPFDPYAEEAECRAYWPTAAWDRPHLDVVLGPLTDVCTALSADEVAGFERSHTFVHPGRDETGQLRRILINTQGIAWGDQIAVPPPRA